MVGLETSQKQLASDLDRLLAQPVFQVTRPLNFAATMPLG